MDAPFFLISYALLRIWRCNRVSGTYPRALEDCRTAFRQLFDSRREMVIYVLIRRSWNKQSISWRNERRGDLRNSVGTHFTVVLNHFVMKTWMLIPEGLRNVPKVGIFYPPSYSSSWSCLSPSFFRYLLALCESLKYMRSLEDKAHKCNFWKNRVINDFN